MSLHIQFQFETFTFNRQTARIKAELTGLKNSQGKEKVDEEGHVMGVTSNKKRLAGAILGSALGAAVGAAPGGGRGAAVGAAFCCFERDAKKGRNKPILGIGFEREQRSNWQKGALVMVLTFRAWVILAVTAASLMSTKLTAATEATNTVTVISAIEDLQNMRNNLGGNYVLANDIDASNANGGQGFVPVGSFSQPFTGSLEGQGHTVSGLSINPGFAALGLFGRLGANASVRNITLLNVSISVSSTTDCGGLGGNCIGAVAGWNDGAISGSFASVSISVAGVACDGGLVGYNSASATLTNDSASGSITNGGNGSADGGLACENWGRITNSTASVSVSGAGAQSHAHSSSVGGLVGLNFGSISLSSAFGAVSGQAATDVGGLVGANEASPVGTIKQSFATGQVTIGYGGYGGGLVGGNFGSIQQSFATGAVGESGPPVSTTTSQSTDLGGLVGLQTLGGTILQSYSSGTVSGPSGSALGGLVGDACYINNPSQGSVVQSYSFGAIEGPLARAQGGLIAIGASACNGPSTSSSYWDTQASFQSSSDGGGSQTTQQLQSGTLPSGFDSSIWTASAGTYPHLIGQTMPGLRFVPVTPCRVADTHNPNGPFGGPFLAAQTTRGFAVPGSSCGIPSTAQAYSVNVTVVPHTTLGFLTMFPCGQSLPLASTLNSVDGRVKAAAAIVPAGTNGGICAFATEDTELVMDINGYFVSATNAAALAFYTLPPCRLADTRTPAGALGGPSLTGGASRIFPLLSSSCNVPAAAQAYSLNFTVVPKGPLGFLTTWPAGQAQPLVSTLNATTGVVTGNAAIVSAGTNGGVSVFATNDTDLIIDINGYFAPPAAGGLSLTTLMPCRVLDTRNPSGASPFSGTLNANIATSGCGVPPSAQAVVLNATVVPPAPLGFLALWPQGTTQPVVSTLNAVDGKVTSNMAVVPLANGSMSAFASNSTYLIVDVSGYFVP